MEEAIWFSTEGDAEPYLIVPPESYQSFHQFLNKRKITRSAGDQRGSQVIIEVPAYSTELEKAIDAWFVENDTEVAKNKEGTEASPTRIKWSYDINE